MEESNVQIALRNPVVLATIFDELTVDQLRQCRLVCGTWFDVALLRWRSSATPAICQFEDDLYLINQNSGQPQIQLREFLRDAAANVNKLKRIPFRQFILKSVDFGEVRNSNLMQGFLDLQGGHITTLELKDCTLIDQPQLQKIIYKYFPNLQRLSLLGLDFQSSNTEILDDEESSEMPVPTPTYGERRQLKSLSLSLSRCSVRKPPLPWIDLFSHFPSLTSLKVIGDFIRIQNLTDLLKSLKFIREHDAGKVLLRTLEVSTHLVIDLDLEFAKEVALFRELQIPLHSVCTFWNYKTTRNEEKLLAAKEFLEMNKSTLQKLEGFANHKGAPLSFPYGVQLDNLQELEMSPDLSTGLEFLKYTPNLRELKIYNKYSRGRSKKYYPNTQIVSKTRGHEMQNFRLTNLTVFRLDYVVSEADLRCLTKWMPNLRKLRMFMNDNQLGIICKSWRDLTDMEVLGNMLSDGGVLGVKSEETTDWVEGPSDEDILPNISLLRDLRYFSCHSFHLTSASVYHGFLKLPSLKDICVNWQAIPRADTKAVMDVLLQKGIHVIGVNNTCNKK